MESRSIKIKDYVTHERVPVKGDSHGNFTLSPLGFPFVNRSGYKPGLPPPTTFSAKMLVHPDLTDNEKLVSVFLEYKSTFDFPRSDSDHDTFSITATLTSDDNGYYISSDQATFYSGCYVSIEVNDYTYELLNRDFTVTSENRIDITGPVSLPTEGIKCTVTFRPELTDTSNKPLFIKFTGTESNDGVYKLVVDEDKTTGILHYTWMYKTSNESVACSPAMEVTFDGTENDNVHDHYRNKVSDQEVAEYIGDVLGAAIECGKFRGAEYPVDTHGLLVKWFLSRGAIVHSVAGKTVVLDGFGHVLDSSGLGDCSSTPDSGDDGLSNIGIMNSWFMSTAGTNNYVDYPTETLSGRNNNIALEIKKSGERHTFVIQQDLVYMAQISPRKTFIHLPTGVDLADGTEVEMNIALPVVRQPDDVGNQSLDVKNALKSFTDYVSQPLVYILSGKQTPLPNNSVLNSGITTSGDSFTIVPKHPFDIESGSIAFGLYNRYECSKTFRFSGNGTNHLLSDGLFVNKDPSKVMFANVDEYMSIGDYILLKYDVLMPVIGKVTEVKESSVVVDFGRELKRSYDGNYVIKYDGNRCNITVVDGYATRYEIELSPSDIVIDDLLNFDVLEVHEEEKHVISKEISEEKTTLGFSSPLSREPENLIHGFVTTIEVYGKAFPYDTRSRKWSMYSKDATCIVDVRIVDAQDGLTEHTEDSGAFDNEKTLKDLKPYYNEPKLIDNDSIIATIYPTSTNNFPWRLNGRNRVRHLGLTTNANVDYVIGGAKPLTRLVFEMNEQIYSGISTMFRGYHPISALRYCEGESEGTPGNTIIGSLLRVCLPSTLDADVDDENSYDMYVVRNATKAFHDLVGDFKVARIGYISSRTTDNKENTSWGYSEDRGTPCPLPSTNGDDNLQRLNDWETKIIHLPNYCLGVNEKLERDLAYAGWNEYTHTDNFRIFYDRALDPFIESDGYGPNGDILGNTKIGNVNYIDCKDAAGTTQKTEENYSYNDDGVPFNYTAENSVFKLFLTDGHDQRSRNQYGAFVYGFMDLPVIKRGLRTISWITDSASEFLNRDMEPFYPMSHVLSTDGVAFPEVNRNALHEVAQSTDDDVKRALLAIPDKVAIYNDSTTKELSAELISANLPAVDCYTSNGIFTIVSYKDGIATGKLTFTPDIPEDAMDVTYSCGEGAIVKDGGDYWKLTYAEMPSEEPSEGDTVEVTSSYTVVNSAKLYMKSLLTMYSNGMPLHMYDSHRAINADLKNGPYGELIYAHEIDLYNKQGSSNIHDQHRYCDLAYDSTLGQESEDVNMTYNLISGGYDDPVTAPLPLTAPIENVSSEFIETIFNGMYTRVHVSAVFSTATGRWTVKDYRQYPTCYLTPLYGAKTIDYTEKSYAYGNPKDYGNRVPMSEGIDNKQFSVHKYMDACPEQPLWQMPCGVGSDYTDGMNKRYVDMAPMEMNPGCVPFMMETFPYGDDGKLNDSAKFRNLYESISVPMDATGEPKHDSVPEVNFWNIKLHIRPARSAYPGADIPSNSARTGGSIGESTLGMFNDLVQANLDYEPITTDTDIVLTTENNESIDVFLK